MPVRWLTIVCFLIPLFVCSCATSKGNGVEERAFAEGDRLAELAEEEAARLKKEEALAAQRVAVHDPNAGGELLASLSRDMNWWLLYGMQERVQYELSLMADQAFLDDMFNEAPQYLHYIANRVRARGMPVELVLLPGVESMFKPYAYSYAHAAGMWQIIPDTGARLGLEINWWHDERRDVKASTEAALDYLESLAQRLDGDYLLALASYNAGIGRIKRAQEKNKKRGKQMDYWSLDLPRQTERYVPRLIALSMIVRDPDNYGVTIPPVRNKPYFAELKTREQMDLQHFASAIGMPFEKLISLNPGYNQRFTDPVKQHHLLTPLDKETLARSYIEQGGQMSENWITHKVEHGQTLSDIALRFNTSTSRLRSINKLANADYVKAGKYLLVPVNRERFDQYIAYHSSSPDKTATKPLSRNVVHKLARGDSLWGLSRKYKVSINDLMRWNNINSSTRLFAGKGIIVKKAVYRPSVEPISLNPEYEHRVVRRVLYPVRRGDSLHSISDKFSVGADEIVYWNPEVGRRGLRRGKTLELYVDITKTY